MGTSPDVKVPGPPPLWYTSLYETSVTTYFDLGVRAGHTAYMPTAAQYVSTVTRYRVAPASVSIR